MSAEIPRLQNEHQPLAGSGPPFEKELAKWLLQTLEGRWSDERSRAALVSQFKLSEDDARRALDQARDGVIRAIGGKAANRPNPKTDPVAYEAFDILWSSFNQNEFFAAGRAPSRKWLDWYRDYKAQTSIDERSQ